MKVCCAKRCRVVTRFKQVPQHDLLKKEEAKKQLQGFLVDMHSFRRAPVLVPVLGLAGLLAAYHNQHSKAPATEISSKSSPNFSTFPPLSGLTFPSPHLSTASCEGWGSRKSTKRIFKYSADDDYPYFSKYHQSLMRKHLTSEVYTKVSEGG